MTQAPAGALATTWLFVPGTRPDRFARALGSGADAVILDLEDAVAPESKEEARHHVAEWLAEDGAAWVRVNGAATIWHEQDLALLMGTRGLLGLVVPKAEDAEALRSIKTRLAHRDGAGGLVALVESATGIHRAVELATSKGVDRLAFGSIDFALDISAEHTTDSLLFARSMLVIASRVAGLPAPLDGVTAQLNDPGRLREETAAARRQGFGGKLCIHPAQVPVVAEAFRPSVSELRWARTVVSVAADSDGVAAGPAGEMIDRPVLERAHRILANAPEAESDS